MSRAPALDRARPAIHNERMEASKPAASKPPRVSLKSIGLGTGLAAILLAGAWAVWIRPMKAEAKMQAETSMDVSALFALQLKYKEAKGVYANDLDTLLSISPDRDAIKARLSRNVDMATFAVVGDAAKFKIEANMLDGERTLIKMKGPAKTYKDDGGPRMTEAPTSAGSGNETGAPVAPPRPR